jgi:hypothetical protein
MAVCRNGQEREPESSRRRFLYKKEEAAALALFWRGKYNKNRF